MNIAGTWYNELGSEMRLEADGASIVGLYKTGVGNAKGEYHLYGAMVPPGTAGQAAGFVVAWVNQYGSSESVTSWSGQYQVINGHEEIVAMWLLTAEKLPSDDWKSTLVGRDTFTRTAPSPAQAEAHAHRYPWSHPAS